jgi:hypothetical protein
VGLEIHTHCIPGRLSFVSGVSEEHGMKPNIGTVERVVRVVVGLGVLSLAFVGPRSPWAYLGIAPLLTGLVGWCPPYALFGISTVRTPR